MFPSEMDFSMGSEVKQENSGRFSLKRKELSIQKRFHAQDGRLEISCEGSLLVEDGNDPFHKIQSILHEESQCKKVLLDLSRLDFMDSSGIVLISSLMRICDQRGISFEISGEDEKIKDMLGMVDLHAMAQGPKDDSKKKEKTSRFVTLGEQTLLVLQNARFILVFIGEILIALFHSLRFPRKIRLGDLFRGIEGHGVNALPMITIVNLLVGMVLAFQAAIQLKQFGANIYVANLVGIAQTREFGPMITAIILAGRSGSAFAAEIGSMKVNEEVDALTTMGLDPVRFLVLPKMLALVIALPVLTCYADFMGIFGGLIVAVTGLDLTVQGYLIQTQKAVSLFDVFSGIVKSFAFAFIVSGVGCLRGFQTRGGADSVGQAATSAVVSGIFLIILVDAIFTVIFQYV